MKVNPKVTSPTQPMVSSEPVTTKTIANEVKTAVADGFVKRSELDNIENLAARDGQPFAKQFAEDFAKLAEAKFSAAQPVVRGFAEQLSHLFHKPDPVLQVKSDGLAERALQKLWSTPGTGGDAELKSLETRFAAGGMTAMEAVVEATGLAPDQRGGALTFLAGRVTSDADAKVLVAAANTGGVNTDSYRRMGEVASLESQRDLGVALAGNPKVSVATLLDAMEPLNGHNVGWDATIVRLRAEVIQAVIKAHPDAETARTLTPQLPLVSFDGADLSRLVVPLAEELLTHGASLADVLKVFPNAIDGTAFLTNSPPEMADLAVKHAGGAAGADADALAQSVMFYGDFAKEKKIIGAMTTGKASVAQVLKAIDVSGTTINAERYQDRRYVSEGVSPEKAALALQLYERKTNTPAELLKIHQYVVERNDPSAVKSSIETLIRGHAVGKEQLQRLIDNVRDTPTADALVKELEASGVS